MFKGQSRQLKFKGEFGYSTNYNDLKAYLKINHEVPPGKMDEGFGMATPVPRLEYYRKSQACHTFKDMSINISELDVSCQEE